MTLTRQCAWAIAVAAMLAGSVCGTTKAASEEGAAKMGNKILGMYVHQHWAYNRPYAARTWTLDDWRGYADGLKKLGFNTILIWPVLETMPDPLTESDVASINKIAAVIDMLHKDFGMKAYLTISPNAIVKSEVASRYTFQERPFFYCDDRADPGDAVALGKMIAWREKLFAPLKEMDGVLIIDSDPGGYAGSTDLEFVYLLQAHRRMFDRLRKGIEIVYWAHAGWEAYGRYYQTAKFEMGKEEEIVHTFNLLKEQNPEPWGISGGWYEAAEKHGYGDRLFAFPYGAIEGEPSFPLTNWGSDHPYKTGAGVRCRGIMGNAQTHCLQLPNTFAFSRGAQGLPAEEADYVKFADDLLPGHGAQIVEGWKALDSTDAKAMFAEADKLEALTQGDLQMGPLKGLLFGDPKRFLMDIALQLRLRASFEGFATRANAEPMDRKATGAALAAYAEAADKWQHTHGYKNHWWWPRMDDSLRKLDVPALTETLDSRDSEGEGATAFDKVKDHYYRIETYTARLIEAMKTAANEMR